MILHYFPLYGNIPNGSNHKRLYTEVTYDLRATAVGMGDNMMNCKLCGYQLSPEMKFCPSCGSRILIGKDGFFPIEDDPTFAIRDAEYIKPAVQAEDALSDGPNRTEQTKGEEGQQEAENSPYGDNPDTEEESSDQPRKTKSIWNLIKTRPYLGVFACMIAGILLYTLFFMDRPVTTYFKLSGNQIQVYTREDKTLVLNHKGDTVHSFDYPSYCQYSRDKSAAVIYLIKSEERQDVELHYVTEEDSIQLSEEYTVSDLSADGRYLFYADKMQEDNYGLYRYDRKTKKEKLLVQAKDKKFGYIVTSPDGKTLVYSLIPPDYGTNENSKMENILLREGKEAESLGANKYIYEVSNDAIYIYYSELQGYTISSLYVRNQGKEIKLMDYFGLNALWVNQDYSEMLCSDGGNTYLYDGGDKLLKIAGVAAIELLLPNQYQGYADSDRMIMVHNFKSFKNKLIRCNDGSIRIVNKEGDADQICRVENESKLVLSSDGNNLLFSTSKGSIKRVSDLYGKCQESTVVSQMSSFITSGDLSQIYYMIGDQLFYKEGTGSKEAIKIAGGVAAIISNGDDTAALFRTRVRGRGELYYSRKGSEPVQLLKDVSVTDMKRMESGNGVEIITITATEAYEYYYNSEGKKVRRIEDEIG